MIIKLNSGKLLAGLGAAGCGIVSAATAAASVQLTDLMSGAVPVIVDPQAIDRLNYIAGITGMGVIICLAILWYLHYYAAPRDVDEVNSK